MIEKLVELGVPESRILSDNRGVRTFDSIRRAASEFGFEKFVIVSDDFHVSRALFIAEKLGLEAVAFPSESVDVKISRKVRVREYFARVLAVLDLYLLHPDDRPRRDLAKQGS